MRGYGAVRAAGAGRCPARRAVGAGRTDGPGRHRNRRIRRRGSGMGGRCRVRGRQWHGTGHRLWSARGPSGRVSTALAHRRRRAPRDGASSALGRPVLGHVGHPLLARAPGHRACPGGSFSVDDLRVEVSGAPRVPVLRGGGGRSSSPMICLSTARSTETSAWVRAAGGRAVGGASGTAATAGSSPGGRGTSPAGVRSGRRLSAGPPNP